MPTKGRRLGFQSAGDTEEEGGDLGPAQAAAGLHVKPPERPLQLCVGELERLQELGKALRQ
jgi:hypothetical protein